MKIRVYRTTMMWDVDVGKVDPRDRQAVAEACKLAQLRINKGEVIPEPAPDVQLVTVPIPEESDVERNVTARSAALLIELTAEDRQVVARRIGMQGMEDVDFANKTESVTLLLKHAADHHKIPELQRHAHARARHHQRLRENADTVQRIAEIGQGKRVADLLAISQQMALHTDDELLVQVDLFDNHPEKASKSSVLQTMIGRASEREDNLLPRLLERIEGAADEGSLPHEPRANSSEGGAEQ